MTNKELYQRLLDASNIIHEKSLKSSGEFIVVSSDVSKFLDKINKRQIRIEKLKQLGKINKKS